MLDKMKTRRHPRIGPTAEHPVSVSLGGRRLKSISKRVEIKDVSQGGMGLRIPLGSKHFARGMALKGIELDFGDGTGCVLDGTVVYRRLSDCGVEFAEGRVAEQKKLNAYLLKMESGIKKAS